MSCKYCNIFNAYENFISSSEEIVVFIVGDRLKILPATPKINAMGWEVKIEFCPMCAGKLLESEDE